MLERTSFLVRVFGVLLATGCVDSRQQPSDGGAGALPRLPDAGVASSAGSGAAEFGDASAVNLTGVLGDDPLREHCQDAPPATHVVRTIDEVVSLANALPKPLTLACFIRALKRPLNVNMSSSILSAQLAVGDRSPRIFIFLDSLILTVVPEGLGSHLLEMGQVLNDTRSIKAELKFPLTTEVQPDAVYEDILFGPTITSCAFCHDQETETAYFGPRRVFISDALRPLPRLDVPIPRIAKEAKACDLYADGERCAMLHSIFLYGQVQRAEFPETFATFGN